MSTTLCVVEIMNTGVLLSGGEEMTLTQAMRLAKVNSAKHPGSPVRILQGGARKPVQTWQDGYRL